VIQVVATVDPNDMRKLFSTFDMIMEHTRKKFPKLLKQAMRYAVISAAKATPPGHKAGKVKSLPVKYRKRPIENIPKPKGAWYYYVDKNGKTQVFKTPGVLTADAVKKIRKKGKKIKRMKKGIKFWSKRKKSWDYYPLIDTRGKIKQIRATDRRVRIPYAGAAKAGWRKALRKLGNAQGGTGADLGMAERRGRDINQTTIKDFQNIVTNLVSYAPKTAPNSARIGLKLGGNRLRGEFVKSYQKKLAKLQARK